MYPKRVPSASYPRSVNAIVHTAIHPFAHKLSRQLRRGEKGGKRERQPNIHVYGLRAVSSSIALQDTASNKPQQHPLSQRHTEHESGKCIVFLKEAKIRRYIKKKYRQGPALAVVIYENIGPRLYPGTKSNITTTRPTSGLTIKPYFVMVRSSFS